MQEGSRGRDRSVNSQICKDFYMLGSIGMPELIIIFVIALIIFGPRKLPELGRSLGKSLNEFKRASNELKNTLDEEIRIEEQRSAERPARAEPARPQPVDTDEHEDDQSVPRQSAGDAKPRHGARAFPGAARPAPDDDDQHIHLTDPDDFEDAGREDVVSGASRRAPEAADRVRLGARRRLRRSRFFFVNRISELHLAAAVRDDAARRGVKFMYTPGARPSC